MNDGKIPNLKFDGSNRKAIFFVAALVFLFLFMLFFSRRSSEETISYSQFLMEVETNQVIEVLVLDRKEIIGSRFDNSIFKTVIPYEDGTLMPFLKEYEVTVTGLEKGPSVWEVVLQILPWILLVVFFWWMFRNIQGSKQALGFGKSQAKRYESSGETLTFEDVAGQKEAKYELQEIVEFLKNPERFTRIGAKIPKGVLLVGNPGTGKTLLAKAVAGEAAVPFFHMSGSDFVEMFVGVGASRVRDLFEQGHKNAPCILFIDEIDAVGRTRGAGYGGGHDEREQTLNQLLVEMDGFNTDAGVIIVAATNRPDVLDPALLRPGRFDRQVVVAMPDIKEREAILNIHARKVTLDKNVNFHLLAQATSGSSGADIANIVNEAALFAGRAGRERVNMHDFEEARDKILMGVPRHSLVFTEEERKMIAYHEAGHTLIHYDLEKADPVHKVTIVPRGQALGVTFSHPEKDFYSLGLGRVKAMLAVLYGGYAAEQMIYGETTTGAQNDIRRATELARRMVCDWGMSELGPVAMGSGNEPIFIGKEIAQHADYSDGTADKIDKAIRNFLDEALNTARKLLDKGKGRLTTLAEALMDRETLNDAEIRSVWGWTSLEEGTS